MRLCVEMGRFPHEWDSEVKPDLGREFLLALKEVEADQCPGCHGWLSEELKADHGYEIAKKYCTRCEIIAGYQDAWAKTDEAMKDVPGHRHPAARRIFVGERLELPAEAWIQDMG